VPPQKKFAPGELVIRVPATCVLFADDESVKALVEQNGVEGGGSSSSSLSVPNEHLKQVVLALALHHELSSGSQSELWPYLATLPTSLASFPVLWGGKRSKELELLVGASLVAREQVQLQAAALRSEFDLVTRAHARAAMVAAAEAEANEAASGRGTEKARAALGVTLLAAAATVDGGGSASDTAAASAAAEAEAAGVGTFLRREWEPLACSFEQYCRAKLLVCSRCFGIGARGDVALLPGVDMLNHTAKPHVALGRSNPPPSSASPPQESSPYPSSSSSSPKTPMISSLPAAEAVGDGFTLTLVREAKAGEQVYSTYDTYNNRPAVSWLLNYGFVPLVEGQEEGEDGFSTTTTTGVEGGEEGTTSSVAAAAARYSDAIAGLEALGPHTHGAVRLLKRERAELISEAL
jgi:hypothetical protein